MAMNEDDIQFGMDQTDKAMGIVWEAMKVIGDNCGPEVQADYQEFVKQFRELESVIEQIGITVGIKQWEEE